MNELLRGKLNAIPNEPGCYLFKDEKQQIIYIGKAKILKKRVTQYFQRPFEGKTQRLVSQIVDVDVIVTLNEKEALLLEIDLIKKHRPKYNIMFMDDKSYPMIKITDEPFPKVLVVRDRKKDKKAKYFGPYPDARAAREMHRLIHEIFPIRKCSKLPNKVCLYYHIKQCDGPCEGHIDQQMYARYIEQIISVLKGQVKDIVKSFENDMHQAVASLDFEQAAVFRDKIASIQYISERQSSVTQHDREDMVDYVVDHGLISLVHFVVKEGKLFEKSASVHPVIDDPNEEATSMIIQFYQQQEKPKQLYVSDKIDKDMLTSILDIPVSTPMRGFKKQQMNMVTENAKAHLRLITQPKMMRNETHDWLDRLEKLLQITSVSSIEMYDVSHTAGSNAVGAMIVYDQHGPIKSSYRKYLLHHHNDDLSSMQEMTYRRFVRALKEKKPISDIIIVDGGYLQVNAVKEVMDSLMLDRPIIGLSKDKTHKTSSIILSDGESVPLLLDDPLYKQLYLMQEEVHRFVIAYHRMIRAKAQTASILDEIDGVGPVRKKRLLKHFKTFAAIKAANVEELSQVIPHTVAENVVQFFANEKENP